MQPVDRLFNQGLMDSNLFNIVHPLTKWSQGGERPYKGKVFLTKNTTKWPQSGQSWTLTAESHVLSIIYIRTKYIYLAGFSDNIATAFPMGTPNMFTREWNASRRVLQLPAKVFVPAIDRVWPLGETCTEWIMHMIQVRWVNWLIICWEPCSDSGQAKD